MLTDAALRAGWKQWFERRLEWHHGTDGDVELALVRLAADGIWLVDLARIELPERDKIRERLLRATRRSG